MSGGIFLYIFIFETAKHAPILRIAAQTCERKHMYISMGYLFSSNVCRCKDQSVLLIFIPTIFGVVTMNAQ